MMNVATNLSAKNNNDRSKYSKRHFDALQTIHIRLLRLETHLPIFISIYQLHPLIHQDEVANTITEIAHLNKQPLNIFHLLQFDTYWTQIAYDWIYERLDVIQ